MASTDSETSETSSDTFSDESSDTAPDESSSDSGPSVESSPPIADHIVDLETDVVATPRLHEEFDHIVDIGKGAFGKVMKARKKVDGKDYAIKEIRVYDDLVKMLSLKAVLSEVKLISRLKHDNVVRYFSSWIEGAGANRALYIQMELCGAQLATVILEGLNEDMPRVWRMFREIVEGVIHIHAHGVIHGDLHPNNIFLDANDRVKIGDFGLSFANDFRRSKRRTSAADEDYSAIKYDIYEVGWVLFSMSFPAEQVVETVKKRLEGSDDKPLPSSEPVVDPLLIRQAAIVNWLTEDVSEKRPTGQELLTIIAGEIDSSPSVPMARYISYAFWKAAESESGRPLKRETDRMVHRILDSADNMCQAYSLDSVHRWEDEILDQFDRDVIPVRPVELSSGAGLWLGQTIRAWTKIRDDLRGLSESRVRKIDAFLGQP